MLGVLATPAFAAKPADNREVRELYEQDQADRAALGKLGASSADERKAAAEKVWAADDRRYGRIAEIVREGGLHTAADYWRAAFLYQHGEKVSDYRQAYALGVKATALDPDNKPYRWIVAAAWDRIMVQSQQPQ